MNPITGDELMALVRQRRSIRRFQVRPVERELVIQSLEAAIWSPSAHNRQPWRFVVITAEHEKRSLATRMADRLASDLRADGVDEQAISADATRSRLRVESAPVVIVVCLSMEDMDRYPDARRQQFERSMAVQSVAMASQNLLLMAHALGLGACWLCAPLFCPDVVVGALDLPPDYEPQGMIILGYPAEARDKTRAPLDSRVMFR